MTDPNALAAKALTQMERTFADPDRLKNSESAMNAFCDAMEGLRVLAPRIAELEAEVARLREALGDIVNPLAAMQRRAEVEGCRLSGMAYSIATDLGFVQNIARTALGASHDADA